MLGLARAAGFTALGNENNHASDLTPAGRDATREALASADLLPLTFDDSPAFVRFGEMTVAVVSVSTVPDRDGNPGQLPSVALEQKLRLARSLANIVAVSIHWGSELTDWPNDAQRQQAHWLVARGVDVLFGSHPHVIQPPECVAGKPVFFSLGNHVFDQKYPATKEGMIADCRLSSIGFRCSALRTQTPSGSSFPALNGSDQAASNPLESCAVNPHSTLSISGFTLRPEPSSPRDRTGMMWIEGFASPQGSKVAWRTRPAEVLSLEAGWLAGPGKPEFLLSLEKHASPIDSERDPRPYVYEVSPHGFIARWRGSALAWPLLDARLLSDRDGILCALHRSDSFLVLSPESKGTRVAAYRWNGFGFDGVTDEGTVAACRAMYGQSELGAAQP